MTYLNKNENIDDIIRTNGLIIIQFGSESCGPCFSIRHKIDDWLSMHPDPLRIFRLLQPSMMFLEFLQLSSTAREKKS